MAGSQDDLRIRLARPDDAAAVVDVHKSRVARWYRQIDNEQHDVGYDDLTLDERFEFGGQWMSVETCAIHLNHLLLLHCLPVVLELDGRIVAEMEFFPGREGPRYGMNCHIGLLFAHSDFPGRGIGNKLVDYAVKIAEERDCDTLTVASDEYHENFYRRCGFTFGPMMASVEVHPTRRPLEIVKLPPQVSAQSFTWGMDMPIGRVQSSALHLSDLAEAFAIPSYADVVKRTDFLEIGGPLALVAYVRHSSGNTMIAAWAQDVSTGDLVDAALSVMCDAGVSSANMFIYQDDYEALEGRVETRLLGHRRTLVCRL
jgi:GNAT superfamily N-acetyltransferase